MRKLNISNITKEDLPAILDLATRTSKRDVFPTLSTTGRQALAMSQQQKLGEIIDPEKYQSCKVTIDKELIAYIAWRENNYIAQLYVDERYQGQGIGSMLIDEVVKQCHDSVLKVRASVNATGFYEKYGFRQTAEACEINHIKFVPMEYELTPQ